MEITKTMTLCEVAKKYPEAPEVLKSLGISCALCPSSKDLTIEEACMIHEVESAELLKKLAVI